MVKLCSRKCKAGNMLFAEYYRGRERVRKSLNLLESKVNIAYVNKIIIPEIERKLKYGLEDREYKLSEFTSMVLSATKEDKKISTYKTYQYAVSKFFSIMGDKSVDLRVGDIDRYIGILKKQGISSATIVVYLAPISLAFNEAIRLDIINKNPVTLSKRPPIKNKEVKVFNILQMQNLLNNAQGLLKLYLHFAFFTGARPNEIMALRWSDISDDCIHIQRTRVGKIENSPKSGKDRKIMMLKPVKDFISSYDKKNDAVFNFSYSAMSNHFRNLVSSLGYERRTLHSIRHTFTSLLFKARENPVLIQHFLGHASLDMINKVYSHYIEDKNDYFRVEKALSF